MESQAASLSLNKLDFSGSCRSPYGLYSPQLFTPHKTRNGELSIMCRNRHCPKCQSLAKAHWLEARQAELLPVPYAHVVFTLASFQHRNVNSHGTRLSWFVYCEADFFPLLQRFAATPFLPRKVPGKVLSCPCFSVKQPAT